MGIIDVVKRNTSVSMRLALMLIRVLEYDV